MESKNLLKEELVINSENIMAKSSQVCKIVIGGDGAVGKTTICQRLSGHFQQEEERLMTIGIDYHDLTISDDWKIRGQIWDCAGQEQFRFIVNSFFRNAKIAIFVFSLDLVPSFFNLGEWIEMVKDENPEAMYLIGNKADAEFKVISTEEAMELANTYGMNYFELSALTGKGFEDFKEHLMDTIINLYISGN